jgi:hypothetical protein
MGGIGVDASSEHQGQTQMGLREFEWRRRVVEFVPRGQADSTVERYLLSRLGPQAVIQWLKKKQHVRIDATRSIESRIISGDEKDLPGPEELVAIGIGTSSALFEVDWGGPGSGLPPSIEGNWENTEGTTVKIERASG